jgi:hypothetical protein
MAGNVSIVAPMRKRWSRMGTRKALTLLVSTGAVLLVIGGAAAAPRSVTRPAAAPAARPLSLPQSNTASESAGVHGGSVSRFHTDCALPEGVAALEGNWTHGDYVSAWATAPKSDAEAVKAAAHGACGMPMTSVDAKARTHGKSDEPHGKSNEPHGKSDEPHGRPQGS